MMKVGVEIFTIILNIKEKGLKIHCKILFKYENMPYFEVL